MCCMNVVEEFYSRLLKFANLVDLLLDFDIGNEFKKNSSACLNFDGLKKPLSSGLYILRTLSESKIYATAEMCGSISP